MHGQVWNTSGFQTDVDTGDTLLDKLNPEQDAICKMLICSQFEVWGKEMAVLETELSFRLPDHNTVFQVEVRGITECVNWLTDV